jgi:hypothetical protein
MGKTRMSRPLPNAQYAAAINANAPSAGNPFATMADIGGGGTLWNNVVIVNNIATDLPAPVAGVITLAADTTYWFNEGTHAFGTDRMVLQNGTNIFGFGKTRTILTYTGNANFISGSNINSVIRDIEFQGANNGTALSISNVSTQSVYVEDVNYRNFGQAASIAGGGFFARYNLIIFCVSAGFTFSGSLGSVILDVCSFRALTSGLAGAYAIKVQNGTTGTSFRCYNGIFDGAANHYGIWIDGAYTLSAGGILRGNVFSGNAVANRLFGVNGNSTGWTVVYGENAGISGLQFVDVEVISTSDAALGNPAGTYIEGSTVRGYILPIAEYDPLATVMEARVTALMTNAAGSGVQVGLRNLTTASNVAGSLGAVTEGTLVAASSVFVAITPNNNYHAYYVKNNGASTRFALKIRVKIY